TLRHTSTSTALSHPHLPPLHHHPFPTRRSSDLFRAGNSIRNDGGVTKSSTPRSPGRRGRPTRVRRWRKSSAGRRFTKRCASTRLDRKSTRLNSSHGSISYAVFCLKKKNISKVTS